MEFIRGIGLAIFSILKVTFNIAFQLHEGRNIQINPLINSKVE